MTVASSPNRAGLIAAGVAVLLAGQTVTLRAEESRSGLAWMSGAAIRSSFSGKALSGVYPTGNQWSEQIFDAGTTDYREGAKHWSGEWWVEPREFCFRYPAPGQGGCFRVVRISANCFELYDFSSWLGQAEEPPNVADVWNGRMWLTEQPTTCEERPVS